MAREWTLSSQYTISQLEARISKKNQFYLVIKFGAFGKEQVPHRGFHVSLCYNILFYDPSNPKHFLDKKIKLKKKITIAVDCEAGVLSAHRKWLHVVINIHLAKSCLSTCAACTFLVTWFSFLRLASDYSVIYLH